MDELRQRYNPEGSLLRRHQLRMLEILKEIDRICQKHRIDYWLSSGTLLGAVRHGGFIPWDDDLDIEMERKDYLRLLQLLPEELNDAYLLQTHGTDPGFISTYAKIRDKYSAITEHEEDINYRYKGIFIDIFQMEVTSYPLVRFAAALHRRLVYKYNRVPYAGNGFRKFQMQINYTLLTQLLYPCLRTAARIGRNKEVMHHTYGTCFLTPRYKSDIYPLSKLQFEDQQFPVPGNTHAYLTKMFGDYMRLPDSILPHTTSVKIDDQN